MFSISAMASACSSGNIANQHRHFGQTSQLRGAPAAFTGNDFVALGARRVLDSTGENRLHDPARLDRSGQFGQRRFVHLRPRLVFAGAQALDRQAALFVTVRLCRCRKAARRGRGRVLSS
jgi:hypothetical protein